jgi:hypothetical protein
MRQQAPYRFARREDFMSKARWIVSIATAGTLALSAFTMPRAQTDPHHPEQAGATGQSAPQSGQMGSQTGSQMGAGMMGPSGQAQGQTTPCPQGMYHCQLWQGQAAPGPRGMGPGMMGPGMMGGQMGGMGMMGQGTQPGGGPMGGMMGGQMGGMGQMQPMGAAASSYRAANQKMHQAMMVPPTGDADRDFALMMIPHHEGAVDMAKIVLQYGKDPEIRKLAEDIIIAQEKEIAFMRGWLEKTKAQAR